MSAKGARTDALSRAEVERWLAAMGLLRHAEAEARRQSGPAWTAALILAATVDEILLAMLAGMGDVAGPATELFDKLLERAANAGLSRGLPMPPGMLVELAHVQRIRNTAVHQASMATRVDAERAVTAARALLDHIASVLGRPNMARGVALGVASLIGDHPAARYLVIAEQQLRQGDSVQAADAAARALSSAIAGSGSPLASALLPAPVRFPGRSDALTALLRANERRLEHLEGWLVSLATGIPQRDVHRLWEILGSPHPGATEHIVVEAWPARDEYVRRFGADELVEEVARLIYLMWLAGLAPGAVDEPLRVITDDPAWTPTPGWRLSMEDDAGLSSMPEVL